MHSTFRSTKPVPPNPARADDARESSCAVAFTGRVRAIRRRKGSRGAYERLEANGGWRTTIDAALRDFVERQSSAFLATANASGQPYVQHRGGPPGFLRVLDERTIAFVEYDGNRQYITHGNLQENNKAQLLLIDYETRRRVKIWGTARVVEDDATLVESVRSAGDASRGEQAIVFHVEAWDANCPRHIPVRISAADAEREIAARDARIVELEQELIRLRRR